MGLIPSQTHSHGDEQTVSSQGDSLTVYVFLHDDCLISQFYTLELTRLYNTYHTQKVGFVGYFPNSSSTPEQIDSFALNYKIAFPLLPDYTKELTRKFGITVTPEVAVWDHRSEQMIYRGRIDDSYVRVGKRKTHPQNRDLENIIDSWLINQSNGTLVQTQAIGCFISFTD
ncbi:MAG: redoxin domain-containing protein [Saprospiraceae bacterium]|nr:redoxin domain-containing protein [Saprospiraceae bacterium]